MKCILTHASEIYKTQEKAQFWHLVLAFTSCLILEKILRHLVLYLPQLSLTIFHFVLFPFVNNLFQTLKCSYFIALVSSILLGINLDGRLSFLASEGHIVIWPVSCKCSVGWDFWKGTYRGHTQPERVCLGFSKVSSPFFLPAFVGVIAVILEHELNLKDGSQGLGGGTEG